MTDHVNGLGKEYLLDYSSFDLISGNRFSLDLAPAIQPSAPTLQSASNRSDRAVPGWLKQQQNPSQVGATAVTPRIERLSRLVLLHAPPTLLGALFDDEAVARYSRVFTLLLQCLYAKHALELVPLARMPPAASQYLVASKRYWLYRTRILSYQ